MKKQLYKYTFNYNDYYEYKFFTSLKEVQSYFIQELNLNSDLENENFSITTTTAEKEIKNFIDILKSKTNLTSDFILKYQEKLYNNHKLILQAIENCSSKYQNNIKELFSKVYQETIN
jgi:hypothetical protein